MMVRFDTSLDLLIVLTSRAGITWGFTIAIMALSFSGKFSGCSLAARALGFSWREAGTVGSFMSCKGCVAISYTRRDKSNYSTQLGRAHRPQRGPFRAHPHTEGLLHVRA